VYLKGRQRRRLRRQKSRQFEISTFNPRKPILVLVNRLPYPINHEAQARNGHDRLAAVVGDPGSDGWPLQIRTVFRIFRIVLVLALADTAKGDFLGDQELLQRLKLTSTGLIVAQVQHEGAIQLGPHVQ
jgi:hypothetical protein